MKRSFHQNPTVVEEFQFGQTDISTSDAANTFKNRQEDALWSFPVNKQKFCLHSAFLTQTYQNLQLRPHPRSFVGALLLSWLVHPRNRETTGRNMHGSVYVHPSVFAQDH